LKGIRYHHRHSFICSRATRHVIVSSLALATGIFFVHFANLFLPKRIIWIVYGELWDRGSPVVVQVVGLNVEVVDHCRMQWECRIEPAVKVLVYWPEYVRPFAACRPSTTEATVAVIQSRRDLLNHHGQ